MLEALAVDLDAAPAATVQIEEADVSAGATLDVKLGADLGLGSLLPDNFDLVDVANLVNVEHVL